MNMSRKQKTLSKMGTTFCVVIFSIFFLILLFLGIDFVRRYHYFADSKSEAETVKHPNLEIKDKPHISTTEPTTEAPSTLTSLASMEEVNFVDGPANLTEDPPTLFESTTNFDQSSPSTLYESGSSTLSTEMSTETSTEMSTEMSTETSTEMSTEISREMSTEMSTETSTEMSTETSTETSTEMSTETVTTTEPNIDLPVTETQQTSTTPTTMTTSTTTTTTTRRTRKPKKVTPPPRREAKKWGPFIGPDPNLDFPTNTTWKETKTDGTQRYKMHKHFKR